MRYFLNMAAAALLAVLFAACGPSVPENAQRSNAAPTIFPDYTDVTLPCNICPPNFMMEGADEVVARLTCGTMSYTFGSGNKVMMDEDDWATLRDAARGKAITVEVYAKKNGTWTAYKPFAIGIAQEAMDEYVSYRLIQPSYEAFEDLQIEQRNTSSFDVSDIYNNCLVQTEKDGQCINCHSYRNYKTDNMLFHARIAHGGTFLVSGGNIRKVDMKTDSTLSAGVYPAWNPTADVIAFSTNKTKQMFLTHDKGKVEVIDFASDLILYDVKANTVSPIADDTTKLEVFPAWSADGKTLYYCMADFYLKGDSMPKEQEASMRYKEVKYSIYARSFDASTHRFGEARMVFDAAGQGKSATLPRVSPDGRYMVFALGNFGCFHVWHSEADIWLLDLQTNEARPLTQLNSARSESYPSFSSNGRWIMTASRRDDGSFTRPYISYFDKQGRCHKAFELPQRDPEYYKRSLRSFNRPEFMVEPVRVSAKDFAAKAMQDAEKVTFKR